ncbi:hypothetical protein ES705_49118 [subsurface metagenome]
MKALSFDKCVGFGHYLRKNRMIRVKGKTVTKYLSDKQAELCREFIQNSNRLEAIIKDMMNVSAKLIETET